MSRIKLRANTGKYVVELVDNGQKGLWAIGNDIIEAVELEFHSVGGYPDQPLRIQFKSGDEYVTLHGETVVFDGPGAVEYRDFEVFWLSPDEIALRASNGKFVARESNGVDKLTADRNTIGSWEIFTVIPV